LQLNVVIFAKQVFVVDNQFRSFFQPPGFYQAGQFSGKACAQGYQSMAVLFE